MTRSTPPSSLLMQVRHDEEHSTTTLLMQVRHDEEHQDLIIDGRDTDTDVKSSRKIHDSVTEGGTAVTRRYRSLDTNFNSIIMAVMPI